MSVRFCRLAVWVLLGVGAGLGLQACGPKTLDARMANGERRANDADHALDDADAALKALDPDTAEAELKEARDLLTHADVEYYPERSFIRERMDGLEKQLPLVRKEKARRELEAKVQKQTALLEAAKEVYEKAYAVVDKKRDLEDDDAEEAADALEELRDALDDGAGLELEDAGYKKLATDTRARVEKTAPKVKLAESLVAFREGPGEKSQSAKERMKKAPKVPKDEQLDVWQDARKELNECQEEGTQLLKDVPELSGMPVKVGARVTTPKAVLASCAADMKTVEKRLKAELERRAKLEAKQKKAAKKKKK